MTWELLNFKGSIMIKKANYFLFVMMCLLIGSRLSLAASLSSVPNIVTAPVVLYDEANNVLANGTYRVTVGLSDFSGTILYSEEQEVAVNNGVAMIMVGQGAVPGSDLATPAGGLDWQVFNVQGDISVQLLVDGQANAQEIAVLTSQPYSYIAQRALSVADDAITSDKIKDGTITAADLDEGLYQSLLNGGTTEDGEPVTQTATTVVDAKEVNVSSSIGLNNASGTNVQDVLKGLDTAIDILRGTNLEQGLSGVQSSITNINSTVSNLDNTYATDAQLSTAVTTINSTVSSLNTTVSNLDSTYATDSDVSSQLATKLSLSGGTMTGNISFSDASCGGNCTVDGVDVSAMGSKVDSIVASGDDTINPDRLPYPMKPVAMGYLESSDGCENASLVYGYNIDRLYTSSSSINMRLINSLTQTGVLLVVAEDVSRPSSQPELDHQCIKGRGYHHVTSVGLTNFDFAWCSVSADCHDVKERALSFVVYLIPD